MTEHRFVCADCGKEKVHVNPDGCGGTGYGVGPNGEKVCYACCGKRDYAEMTETGRAVLYLTIKEGKPVVQNWPGTLTIPIRYSRKGRHNIAGVREDVWFTGPDGCEWWGVCIGRNTQICRVRRLKAA